MKWPAYPKYKDSGIEWLGEVPEGWGVVRLRFLGTVQTGVAKGKDYGSTVTAEVSYLRVANVQDGYLDLSDVSTISLPPNEVQRYLLKSGDLLMNEGGDYDKLGRGYVWNGEIDPCIHQNHVFALRTKTIPSWWLNLITNSAYAKFYFMTRSKQTTNLASISSTNLMELPVVVPPLPEQHAIASFLDRETGRIDLLVSKKRTLIERLKEKRTALISRTVTRGLPPAAARAAGLPENPVLKPSGIEWLGEVPEGWGLTRFGYIFRFFSGGTPSTSEEQFWDGDIPWVSSKDMKSKVIQDTEDHISALAIKSSATCLLPSGSLLMVNRSGILRHSLPVATISRSMAINQDIRGCVPFAATNARFIVYLLTGNQTQLLTLWRQQGATVESLNFEAVKATTMVLPPLPEQQAIAAYLDAETAKLDALVAKVEAAIERLLEYRTALITAAVTGKIDVRGATNESN